ncbi:MAG: SDR family oxidoreductase [Bacteroidota bacterium]|nr:SDR family oxidoreductase [Bacteroidota bacterium]MDP4233189.1 SDR family oxidoreductase [Bacteroidota bacterium]MDP4242192.1 SDR family oxidoreductase [Bacteroidota bacterium]MDP4287843.1 SDR family oxidoreductase [Bacteroidota bacterium]
MTPTKLQSKTVFITGASSGIGQATATAFAAESASLLLCARRIDRLKELKAHLYRVHPEAKIHVFELDVRDRKAVDQALDALPEEWRHIDILVNNAGLSRGLDKLHEGSIEDWEEMLDTNVKGLLYVTRKVMPGMIERKHGHIINIGSIAGHEVYQKGNVYCASKHAVDAITKGLRLDVVDTPLRVTTIDPGLVETEFSEVRFHGDTERASTVYKGFEPLQASDIADTILWCATRPPHVQIAEIVIFPTAQASATTVHRQ